MNGAKHICFTFAGDISRDSRLRRFTETLAEEYRVTVLALTDSTPQKNNDIDVICFVPAFSSLRLSLPYFWRQATKYASALNADVYCASDVYTLPAAARVAKAVGAYLIYDARELYSSIAALRGRPLTQRFWSYIERHYAQHAALMMTVNDSLAGILRSRGYQQVLVVRNVSDWGKPQPGNKLRELTGLPKDTVIVLSQGGLQKGRGAFPAIQALTKVPGCSLVFLGDGPLSSMVLQQAALQGVKDRVFVVGSVPSDELSAYTASADIGLCLIEALGDSYRLSLPNKLFEYIAAGLAVLGSNGPEISSVLQSTSCGVSVDPAVPEAVAAALHRLVCDTGYRRQCAEHATTAAAQYTWENEKTLLLSTMKEMVSL